MNAEESREIWESLGVIEDWLRGGVRRRREPPDFEALSAREEAAGAAPAPVPPVADSLEAIAREVENCRACRLCEKRRRAVPGQGPAAPLAMVVGEGPGAEEDAQGLPFVGPAGKLLDKMLASIGLSRGTNCFIANVVKCGRRTTAIRRPTSRRPASATFAGRSPSSGPRPSSASAASPPAPFSVRQGA